MHIIFSWALLILSVANTFATETTEATSSVALRGDGCFFNASRPQVLIIDNTSQSTTALVPQSTFAVTNFDRQTPGGSAQAATYRWTDAHGYVVSWTLSRLERMPGVTLQMTFENHAAKAVRLREFQLCQSPAAVKVEGKPGDWWLSTLDSHDSAVGGFNPSDDLATKTNRNFLDILTLYTECGTRGLLMGAVGPAVSDVRFHCQVNESEMGLVIASEMNDIIVDPGETRCSEEVLILAEPFDIATPFLLHWLAATHGSRVARGPLTGWCSWYSRGTNISAESIGGLCAKVKNDRVDLPLQVIQVDDGWQKAYGDWDVDHAKFPKGMKAVADEICVAGAIPGIWLCPVRTSKAGQHPDGTANEYQDASNPAVREFIRKMLAERVAEGYRYFKLDFLWIRNLSTRCDQKKTRLEICRDVNKLYRETIGEDSYLDSCVGGFNRGCFGYADAARIGTDTTRWFGKMYVGCNLANSINAIGSTAWANGILFANDPDVTYLDYGRNELLRTWYSFVGLLGGMMLTSEPLANLTPNAQQNFERLQPPAPDRGRAFDGQTDPWHRRFGFVATRPWGSFAAVLLWNPATDAADVSLSGVPLSSVGNKFHVWSFWDEKYLGIADTNFLAKSLPSHSSALLRLTPVSENAPVIIGSTLHISMGSADIKSVSTPPNRTVVELTDGGSREGNLYIFSAHPLCLGTVEGCQAKLENATNDVWRIIISNRQRGEKQTIEVASSRSEADAVTPKLFKRDRHEQFIKRKADANIRLLFLGDSITDWWPKNGGETWAKFAPYDPADFGVMAMRTEGLLWNISNGELDGIKPKVVVILIGVNNLLQCPDEKPEWVAAGIHKVVETVRQKSPESKIVLLAILPARNPATNPIRARIAAVNPLIAKLADGDHIRFLDIGSAFLDAAGNVRKDLTLDALHPNAKGYQVWYDAMQPMLVKMMENQHIN